ncbi:TetR/AcrR family transcriptional regulator [Albimonas sp. CAU 1670]|uniref:TetR/AcrR family transcriptional regulator n=1 Tax=Albimonas sp. CAU 1670 TaxID=3032599 RepID=UPI0023DA6B62|nr:TetR/AcrR family transcriptional regulator [Albimonas sp. CAU 1670]MDF2233720.1 TetR/AcrR family transcriptional regulator [Albimonas sp. CAU 1670]
MTVSTAAADASAPRAGEGAPARRHAAGADPAKRAQILHGAARVFLDKGFESASMEDVRRAAGVSKGTIYVYFSDKEELFEALIADKRDRIFAGLSAVLEQDLPLDEKLTRFGEALCRILCSDEVVAAQRIVIGAVARLPEMGERFYKVGPSHMKARLAEALAREVEAGRLAVPDPMMAATQFIELATAGLWRRRLFCGQHGPVDEAEVARTVAAAVDMLLRAYGRGEAARG